MRNVRESYQRCGHNLFAHKQLNQSWSFTTRAQAALVWYLQSFSSFRRAKCESPIGWSTYCWYCLQGRFRKSQNRWQRWTRRTNFWFNEQSLIVHTFCKVWFVHTFCFSGWLQSEGKEINCGDLSSKRCRFVWGNLNWIFVLNCILKINWIYSCFYFTFDSTAYCFWHYFH